MSLPAFRRIPVGNLQVVSEEYDRSDHIAFKHADSNTSGDSTKSSGAIYNFLSENIERIQSDPNILTEFEKIINASIKGKHQALLNTLKTFGWTGTRFKDMVDWDALLQALGNLYISQQRITSPDGSFEGEIVSDEAREYSEAETFLSFVPSILISHIASHTKAIENSEGASCSPFVGAAMLADISGFSKYAGTMCSRGVKGLDDLHATTSGFLDHFVQIVHQYGGDVVAFAGDALICVFEDQGAQSMGMPPPIMHSNSAKLIAKLSRTSSRKADMYYTVHCSIRALECGLVLKEHAQHPLFTHIGISYGDMKISVLGGHNEDWTYLVNGPCISELASCITDSGPQQLVITRACYDVACANYGKSLLAPDTHVTYATRRGLPVCSGITAEPCVSNSGNVLLGAIVTQLRPPKDPCRLAKLLSVTAEEVIDIAKLFVPAPVMAAVYTDSLERISELRHVTTMFLSLDSYSPEKHHDPMTLQPFFRIVQETLHDSGGYLRQFIVDDKGCAVIAMWGVPSFSFASNCARALYCAVTISGKSESLNLKCSAGISTGSVFCGTVGSPERKDYVVIGNEVNMAARLMGKAHGRVLVDAVTLKHLSKKVKCMLEIGEELLLKGSSEPMHPYVYIGLPIPNPSMLDDYDDAHRLKTTILPKRVTNLLSSQLDKISNINNNRVTHARVIGNSVRRSVNANHATDEEDTRHAGLPLHQFPHQQHVHQGQSAPMWDKGCIFTIINGIPGTGKSTASRFFLFGAQRRNLACYSVKCRSGEELHSYSLVRKIFLEIVGVNNFRDDAQQRHVMTYIVDKLALKQPDPTIFDKSGAYTALEHILGLHVLHTNYNDIDQIHDNNQTSGRDESNRKVVVSVNFEDVLSIILHNKKTVVVIDDAHFSDELSWYHLHEIIMGDHIPLAVLLTCCISITQLREHNRKVNEVRENSMTRMAKWLRRMSAAASRISPGFTEDDSVKSSVDESSMHAITQKHGKSFHSNSYYKLIAAHSNCEVVELVNLNEQEVKDILLQEIPPANVVPELVTSVLAMTSGNAYWCKTVAQFIKEQGIVSYQKAIVRRGAGHNTLKTLVLSRVDMLTGEQQIVAKHASIIGDEFSLSMLTAVLPAKLKSIIVKALVGLQQFGLMSCIDEAEAIFAFQNQLIRNVLYDLTPPSDACAIHLAIANYIESKHAADIINYFPALSYHYRNSKGTKDQALKYTAKAADQLIRQGAFDRGYVFLRTALPLAVSRPKLRVLLLVANRGVKATNSLVAVSTGNVGKSLKRMASFKGDSGSEKAQVSNEYKDLRDEIEGILADMTADKEKDVIEIDATKMTNSSRVLFGVLDGARSLLLPRQASGDLTWYVSDPNNTSDSALRKSGSEAGRGARFWWCWRYCYCCCCCRKSSSTASKQRAKQSTPSTGATSTSK